MTWSEDGSDDGFRFTVRIFSKIIIRFLLLAMNLTYWEWGCIL